MIHIENITKEYPTKTLFDSASAEFPVFPGAKRRLHLPFPDPAKSGDVESFREVRDQILQKLKDLFDEEKKR